MDVAERRTAAAVPACLFAFLLPGAGHLYLRRTGKGLLLLGAVGALFVFGVAMDARLHMYIGLDDPLSLLRSVAQMAIGIPYFVARGLGFGFDEQLVKSVAHEYGNTFTEVGGLLNVLIALDAYDIAVGRKP